MKGISTKDLRGNDIDELGRTLSKLRQDLFQGRMKKNTNQLENTMLVRKARRDIARVMTVMSEKRNAAAIPAAEAKE